MYFDENLIFIDKEHFNNFALYLKDKHLDSIICGDYDELDTNEVACYFLVTGFVEYTETISNVKTLFTNVKDYAFDDVSLIIMNYAKVLMNQSLFDLDLIHELSDEYQVIVKNALDIALRDIDLIQDKLLEVINIFCTQELSNVLIHNLMELERH